MPKPHVHVVVIGAGPAGLTAAYELSKAGVRSVLLEKDRVVGGLSRTVNYKGYHFDIGGHRFFTKVKAVDEMWPSCNLSLSEPRQRAARKNFSRGGITRTASTVTD